MKNADENYINATKTWLEKAVIGLNLCPFAKAPYVKNKIRLTVSHARHIDDFLTLLDEELMLLSQTNENDIETTLLIEPKLFNDFLVFNELMTVFDDAIIENHLEGILQIAPFHPQFQFAEKKENDITNYTNRSPYPILHLIRETSIDKAVLALDNPDIIYERNINLLEKMRITGWEALNIPYPNKDA